MSNCTTLKTLFTALRGSLPYEYDEKLIANEDTIILTKEGSDNIMYLTVDTDDTDDTDDVIAIGYDDPNRGYFVEYVPIYQSSEDEQIPLDTIIDNAKHCL